MVFPTGGGEATNLEKMEGTYESMQSLVTEEEDGITFPYWKGVDKYRYHVDPTLLSAKFTTMFPEVASLLNYRVERTVIVNVITKDNNKLLGDKSNKTAKFHSVERIMEETVSTFQNVVEAEQQNGGPQKK